MLRSIRPRPTSVEQVQRALGQIRELNPSLEAVLEVAPDALDQAEQRDAQTPRGPLYGVPVLIKDNINTAHGMHTSAGSLALADSYVGEDAPLVRRLIDAGAVILGKTNLSEWSAHRSSRALPGWSARAQTRNY